MYKRDPWKDFSDKLESYDRALANLTYQGAFEAPKADFRSLYPLPPNSVTPGQAQSILSAPSLGPPHGFDLLTPVPIPELPKFPERPPTPEPAYIFVASPGWGATTPPNLSEPSEHPLEPAYIAAEVDRSERRTQEILANFTEKFQIEKEKLREIRRQCDLNNYKAIGLFVALSHLRHPLPAALFGEFHVDIDHTNRIALCTARIPDFNRIAVVKRRGNSCKASWLPVSASEKSRNSEAMLYSLCLRAVFLLAKSDAGDWFDTVAVNAQQKGSIPRQERPAQALSLLYRLQKMRSRVSG
jgi:hypothetical protein